MATTEVPDLTVLEDEDVAAPQPAETQDIDPMDWLTEDTGPVTRKYTVRPGKTIFIAPITDAEELVIQRASRKPDPRDPRRMTREFNLYKRMFIAASINKAYNRKAGEPGYILPDQLAKKNVGELTGLLQAIMELSGLETARDTTPQSFFD